MRFEMKDFLLSVVRPFLKPVPFGYDSVRAHEPDAQRVHGKATINEERKAVYCSLLCGHPLLFPTG